MDQVQQSRDNSKKIKTISHALSILNEIADESADEIRGLVKTDFQNLKKIMSDVKPEIEGAYDEMKKSASETMAQTKQKVVQTAKNVDASVHQNAWIYLGGVAAASAVLGFLLGRGSSECEPKEKK